MTELKSLAEIYEQLDCWSFGEYGYYPDSGDLEFLAGSGAEMTAFKLDWLNRQGFKLQGIWMGATHKIVFSFTAKRNRFRLEKGY